MNDHFDHEPDDRRFERLLAGANEPLGSEPFVGSVVQRIRRRTLVRRAVLGTSVVLGLGIAGRPLLDLSGELAAFARVIGGWSNDAAWVEAHGAYLGLAAVAVLWPALVRWLAR